MAEYLRRILRSIGWPYYNCEDCNGMAYQYGVCECDYRDAYLPGIGPRQAPWYAKAARWVCRKVWGQP